MIGEACSALEEKFWDLSRTVVTETGYELYDVEYVKGSKTLRVYIADKNTGSALIEDCVAVDRAFTPYVEEADWIPDDFVLEVSSPGVYRKLRSLEQFQSALGETIQVDLFKALDKVANLENAPKKLAKAKNSKKLRGLLKECDNEKIILETEGIELELQASDIKKANLDPDL